MIKKNKILIILFTFILLIFFPKIVNAKYLNISAPDSGKPGDTVNVSISTDCTGRFNVSISNGTLNGTNKYWLENSSATFSVTLGKSGNTTINILPANPVSLNRQDIELANQSKNIKIDSNISNGGSSSSNNSGSSNSGNNNSNSGNNSSTSTPKAELSMITTSPVDFKGFKTASSGPYYVTVENSVTELKVGATSKNGSTYSVKGNTNLQEGTNKITVTAKNGNSTKEYYIYVTRKTANNEPVIPNQIDEDNKKPEEEKQLRLNNIILDDKLNVKLDPNFDSEIFEYTLILGNEYLDLEEILIKAVANVEGAIITISGNENLIDGENIIKIVVAQKGYETVTYTIKVIKGPLEQTQEVVSQIIDTNKDFLDNSNEILKKKIVICSLTFLIALIGIIFIAKQCYETTNNDDYMQEDKSYKYNQNNNQKEFGEDNILKDIYTKNLNYEEPKQDNEYKVNLDELFNSEMNFYEGKTSRRRGKGKHS